MTHAACTSSRVVFIMALVLTSANACGTAPPGTEGDDEGLNPSDTNNEGACRGDADCLFSERCVERACVSVDITLMGDNGCITDADCSNGTACAPSTGACVPVADAPAPTTYPPATCANGEVRPCGSKVGACQYGEQACVAGEWADTCVGGVGPVTEVCNGLDDDCDGVLDPAELDSDGDGVRVCNGDCNDADAAIRAGAPEICDGKDNDCDPTTPDGADVPGIGAPCDGPDADLCPEGVLVCSGGLLSCTDDTDHNPELCDGIDNDCNPATPDGAEEPGFGEPCDGSDVDLCPEGILLCDGTALFCTDTDSPAPELCDGIDNDCDPTTPDGADDDCASVTGGNSCYDGLCQGGRCVAVDNGTCGPCLTGTPTADAGPDLGDVIPDTVVQLDGSGSSDPNGDPLTYSWRVDTRPSGSSAAISDVSAQRPTLLADVSGEYVVCLTVTDTNDCSSAEDCMSFNVRPQASLHIELVWFSDNSDIDLHYLANNGNFFATYPGGDGPDCFYSRKNPDWGSAGTGDPDGESANDPVLDVDNTRGFGPENINQDVLFDTADPFTVGVHYYSDKGITGSVSARVRVYVDGNLAYEQSKALVCDQMWEVATIEVSGSGTVVGVTGIGGSNTYTAGRGYCTGSSSPQACCSRSPNPGCATRAIESCVCAFDNFCCTTAWDSVCVSLVESLGCGTCP